MKLFRSIIGLLLLSTIGCADIGSPSSLNPGNPPWVNQLIVQFENAPPGSPPQSIWRYVYKGRTVYYIPAQCCDQFSTLYDSTGVVLCAPDGGFTGGGDRRCPDFFQQRSNEVLIWKDPRTR